MTTAALPRHPDAVPMAPEPSCWPSPSPPHAAAALPRRRLLLAAAALGGLPLTAPARASDAGAGYPARPVRLVVGFPPGGPTDRLARELAAGLQAAWGQPVLVDNRPGAGSRVAFEAVARAEPDGHTLLIGALQTATHMALPRKPSFDTLRDFAPVTQLTSTVLALTVAPSLGVSTVDELVARARARPGELAYASFGIASSAHFAGALFEQQARLQLLHVPFGGAGPAQTAVIGGQVAMGFASALSSLPLMQAGRLRALAVAAERRLAALPAVPTLSEAGYPGVEISSWQGLLAPAATAPAIVDKLQRACARWLAQPEVRERLLASAAEPVGSTPAEFRGYIQVEIAKWTAVAQRANIQND